MIRGLQKQMIQLATPNSKYFEVVLFVLRPTACRKTENEAEMVRAAQKILLESTPRNKRVPAVSRWQRWRFFFCGVLCGALLCGATVALFAALL
ncbi:MAG: hypothetical protein J6Q82_02470 [Clostridia bacterium]|nr:hypothetical protein [Clostridia bacterium]